MPGQIRITFRNFVGLDLSGSRKIPVSRYQPPHFGEQTAIEAAIEALGGLTPAGRVLRSLKALVSPPPAAMTLSGTIPGVRIRSPFPDFTIADGVGASAGAVTAFAAGGGIYFWNKSPSGEIGLYGSLSVGLITNIGASAGFQIALMFGRAPDVLAGDSITVSVDVGIDVVTVTGMLILSAPPSGVWPPPNPSALAGWVPEVIGVGFGMSAGWSALPVDISVMPSRTWTHPIDPLHPLTF